MKGNAMHVNARRPAQPAEAANAARAQINYVTGTNRGLREAKAADAAARRLRAQ
jgi:hypothetical protein